MLYTKEIDLAKQTPMSNEPMSPGPEVTAIADISVKLTPALFMVSWTMGRISSICLLEASSGTIPPYLLWISSWLDTMLDKIVLPSSTTAAEVSSHDVSIPKINIFSTYALHEQYSKNLA
jgi:hypothetical protein